MLCLVHVSVRRRAGTTGRGPRSSACPRSQWKIGPREEGLGLALEQRLRATYFFGAEHVRSDRARAKLSMPGVRRSVANVGYPRATVIYVRQAQGPLAASLQGPGSWLQL